MIRPHWAIERFLGVGFEKELAAICKRLRAFSKRIIDERRIDPSLAERSDLLSLFMRSLKSDDDDFLHDIVMSFFIAGRDTTACTLTFVFYLLSQHQDWEEKLIAEIDSTFGGRAPTYDELVTLPLLDGVVKETLRLFPPVPTDPKYCVAKDTLPSGAVVPANSIVVFEPYRMGRHASLWERPLEFDPARWSGKPVGAPKNAEAFKFPVFQAGPRFCLGMNMAMLEVKLVVVSMLQRFRVRVRKGADMT